MKHFTDVSVLLCAYLEILDSELLCQFFCFFKWYFSIIYISFVSYNDFYNILACIGFNLLQPVLKRLKWSLIADGIYHDYAHGTFIVSLCDSFESLLTSSIPYLQSYFLAVYFKSLYLKIDSFIIAMVPIVVRCEDWKLFSQNLSSILVFPTPLSPIINSLAR